MNTADSTPSPSNPCSTNDVPGTSLAITTSIKMEKLETSSKHIENPVTPRPVPVPTSFSEWQLMAVLQRANLLQYYDTFIAQGGDDINQIMQCDENEFMEIMHLVGMISKPLHVRRMQRALTEFSKDQASFNMSAIQQIGAPPPSPQFAANNDPMSYLMPGLAATLSSLTSSSPCLGGGDSACQSDGNTQHNSVPLGPLVSPAVFDPLASDGVIAVGGTAVVSQGSRLIRTAAAKEEERSSSPLSIGGDFVSLGESDPNVILSESPVLSDAQLSRIFQAASKVFARLPAFEPKLIQNKKRVSGEVLDLMTMSTCCPSRIDDYRKYSAIYGRFDAKRKPHKVLSLHEVSVNEAAAQLCLLMPALLTRRDELFPLSRQVVKEAGYNYTKSRKRPLEQFTPNSSPPPSPSPHLVIDHDDISVVSSTSNGENPAPRLNVSSGGSYLERWAEARLLAAREDQDINR